MTPGQGDGDLAMVEFLPSVADAFPAPRDRPLDYPGRRPPGSFLLANARVLPISIRPGEVFGEDAVAVRREPDGPRLTLRDVLKDLDAAPLSARHAVIGYGSNPVPGQLVSKFGGNAVVPVLYAELAGCDVVYNLVSNFGYAFAEMAFGADLGRSQVAITFLDARQLALMRESEQNYRLAHSPQSARLEGGQVIEGGEGRGLYLFAGFRRVWVPAAFDAPAAVAELPCEGRRLQAVTQRDCLALAIQEFGLDRHGIGSPEALARRLLAEAAQADAPGKLKYELQARVDASARSWPALVDQVAALADDAPVRRVAE